VLAGLHQALSSFDGVKVANGLYWAIIPLLAVFNGALVLQRVRRRKCTTSSCRS
jgi:hypothetical protein